MIFLGFILISGGGITGKIINNQNDIQNVKLSVSGGTYILSPDTLKKDVLVRLEADSSVQGCARSVVIPSFNVRKIIYSDDNIIEFYPDKEGTFNIACSMNMYRGQFKVSG